MAGLFIFTAAVVALIAPVCSGLYIIPGAGKVPLPTLFSEWAMKDRTIVAAG